MAQSLSSAETFPPQAAFFHAILRHLSAHHDGEQRTNIHEAMPELLGLSESQRRERLSNQPHLRYRWRSGWSLSVLKAAGYVDNPSRAMWRITEQGQKLLAQNPGGLEDQNSRQIIRESRLFRGPGQPQPAPNEAEDVPELTPDERIDAAVDELRNSVAGELLSHVLRLPPVFFEELVLDLLHALGYGSSEDDLQRVGGTGDGGIDGIISLDRLGFEKVYVQAKRWQHSVGRPEIQAFYGALAARRAKKGVFITTSGFTREARDFGAHVAEAVVLIDGERLTSLMIDYGVGVTHYRTIRLPRVDLDYFESE